METETLSMVRELKSRIDTLCDDSAVCLNPREASRLHGRLGEAQSLIAIGYQILSEVEVDLERIAPNGRD